MFRLVLLVGYLIVSFESLAQDKIIAIQFKGIDKTKEVYINKFIDTQIGDEPDTAKIHREINRLTNLEMFGDVSYQLDVTDEGVVLTYFFKELFTLLPIVNFGSLTNNFWFQLGASDVNLLGMGHKFYAYYQYYDRSSVAVHLNLVRIKSTQWDVNFNYIKWSTLEPLFFDAGEVFYNYDNYTYGADLVHHFNFNNSLLFGGAFFTEEYTATSTLVEGAPSYAFEKKMLFKLIFKHQQIKQHYFQLWGYTNRLTLQHVRSFSDYPLFFIGYNDFKYYKKIREKGNLAVRLRLGLSSNNNSPFAPFVLDSYLNIRGVGNRVDRGTGTIVLNAEYRHSLLNKQKLALQLVAFMDTGTWRTPGGGFDDFMMYENQEYFGGLGIRFIHKKIHNAILRIDYGAEFKGASGSNGIVIGLGQYF